MRPSGRLQLAGPDAQPQRLDMTPKKMGGIRQLDLPARSLPCSPLRHSQRISPDTELRMNRYTDSMLRGHKCLTL